MEHSYTETTGDPGMGHADDGELLTVEQVLAYTATRDRLISVATYCGHQLTLPITARGRQSINRRLLATAQALDAVTSKLNEHDKRTRLGNDLIAWFPFTDAPQVQAEPAPCSACGEIPHVFGCPRQDIAAGG